MDMERHETSGIFPVLHCCCRVDRCVFFFVDDEQLFFLFCFLPLVLLFSVMLSVGVAAVDAMAGLQTTS
jgi:hypothetical protein